MKLYFAILFSNAADMHKEGHHPWSFSLFAAAFASFYSVIYLFYLAPGADPDRSLTNSETLWWFVIPLAILAFVSARTASYFAIRLGTRDHGVIAGYLTWPPFTLCLLVYFSALDKRFPLVGDIILIVIGSIIYVLPACVVGAVSYLLILHVWARMIGAHKDPDHRRC